MKENEQQHNHETVDATRPQNEEREQPRSDTRIVRGTKKEQLEMPCKPLYGA